MPNAQTMPVNPVARDTFDTPGGPIEIRGLTRAETIAGQRYVDNFEKMDAWLVACACDIEEGVALEWLRCTNARVGNGLVARIVELSGMGDLGNA